MGVRVDLGNRRRGAVAVGDLGRQTQREPARGVPFRDRKWPRKLAGIGMRVGMIVGVAWGLLAGGREVYEYATTSARFEVQHFVFQPTKHVDDEQLRELLAIAPATNILALDLEALSQQLTAHPWVSQASVVRSLPDTLTIDLVEHEPAALVLAGRFYLVDADGVPFKQLEAGERGDLPIITGVERDALRDPEARDAAVAAIARGLGILRLYQAKQRPRVGELHLADDGSVVLYTAETGTQLMLGRDAYEERLARWDALRFALGDRAERLAVVHLDHESRPDRRDRVVARFVSDQDQAVLLAEAAQAEFDSPNPDDAEGSAAARPKARRNRIPRYE